ncbi:hypothetical protein LCGC14_1614390 [marine sediment metagenome]|uniref:Uncharacterized protein n=1 Tax=marine sediment metagenome TaxID=412755 RepID=A0A0F9IU59_9ZZZZ
MHYHYIEDSNGDLVDLIPYCSDTCHRLDQGDSYQGWNGCHESQSSERCTYCDDPIRGIEDGLMMGDSRYEGDLNTIKAAIADNGNVVVVSESNGRWTVEIGYDDKRCHGIAEWGAGSSLDEAWRYAAGAWLQ